METYTIEGDKISVFGKSRGSNANKFNRVAKLASMFNEIDDKMNGFIKRGTVTHHARCAIAVRLMLHTGIRIGNESSAEGYMTKPHPNSKVEPKFVQTYGLTTLSRDHVLVKKGKLYINFVGKKQVDNSFIITNGLVSQVKTLVSNNESNTLLGITAYELTKFIRKYVGKQFTPKDFRTLRANIEAWKAFKLVQALPAVQYKKDFNAEIKSIAVHVSECLNNTPGVCKKSYIDDMLFTHHAKIRWNKN